LLGLVAPFLADASVGLFPKGRDVEAEIAEARRIWAFDCALVRSLTDEDARIAVVRHLGALREVEP
jgi:16S rRNA (guanine527-N7)-methyltransferase